MTTNAPVSPTIRFDEKALRRFSASGQSGTSSKSRKSSNAGSARDLDSDEEHPQDWTKTTNDEDSWANRERRRSTIWAKTDHNTPFAEAQKEGRRGSILSLWSPGQDKDGKPILKHLDDESAIIDEQRSESGNISLSPPGSRRGTNQKTGSQSQDRRPSILGVWRGGKDEQGRSIMLHDDEEWDEEKHQAREPQVVPETIVSPKYATTFIPSSTAAGI